MSANLPSSLSRSGSASFLGSFSGRGFAGAFSTTAV